jgi:hypothetical protein
VEAANAVAAGRHAVGGELVELGPDLVEAQAHALGEHDERHAPDHWPREAAVAGRGAIGADQPALLVEAKRRCGHAAPCGQLADGQLFGHMTDGSTQSP